MVNFHTYIHVAYQPLYVLQNLLERRKENGTVLDLIVICEKKGTIKYSDQIAEFCEFEVK